MSVPKSKLSLPYGWEVHQSTSMPERVYYFNRYTKAKSWDCPKLISNEEAASQRERLRSSQTPPLSLPVSPQFLPDKAFKLDYPIRDIFPAPRIPEALLSPPSKAVSPPCVSSSSEVQVEIIPEASSIKATMDDSKHTRQRIRRPDLKSLGLESKSKETKSTARYEPYSHKKPKTVTSTATKTSKTYISFNKPSVIKLNGPANRLSMNGLTTVSTRSASDSRQIKTAVRRIKRFSAPCDERDYNSTNVNSKSASSVSARATPVLSAPTRVSLKPTTTTSVRKSAPQILTRLPVKPVRPPACGRIMSKTVSPIYAKSAINKLPQNHVINHASPGNSQYCSTDVEMLDLSNDNLDSSKGYCIVLDTNVLIWNLKLVDELKDSPLEGCGPPTIIVPWMVLQELDGIKNQRGEKVREDDLVHKASEAVRYIYEMFQAKHPRITGQSSSEYPKYGDGSLNPSCNDDMILYCCLKRIETVPRDKVILLTNDKNLCNKAMVHQVKAYTTDTIFQQLKVDFSVNSSPVYALSCRISLSNCEGDENLRTEVDRIMILAKSALKMCFAEFLEKEMRSVYGEELWETIVYVKPPWSLLDILECFSRHWVSVFNFILEREMQKEIDRMRTALRTVKGYICDEEQALSLVTRGLSLCCAIAAKGSTTARESQEQLLLLKQQLLCLGRNNSPSVGDNANKKTGEIKRNESPAGVSLVVQRKTNHHVDLPPDAVLDMNTRVKQVFHHVWNVLNHFCGTALDSLGWPHKLEYERPPCLPSKEETNKFIAEFYPQLHKLKKLMQNVISGDQNGSAHIDRLFRQLLTILPSLHVKEFQPVRVTDEEFRLFCTNNENKDILQGGYKQLSQFFNLVHKSIVGKK